MTIVGFSSRKSGGKTLCSTISQKYGYIPINFADSLKNMICHILDISIDYLENHKNNPEIVFNINSKKMETIIEYIHKETDINKEYIRKTLTKKNQLTIREYLQIIGTDLIRKYNPNWHIQKLISKMIPGKNYVIGDVRFLNEKMIIEQLGGKCYYIIRPFKNNYEDISNHISEVELNWTMFEPKHILINDSTIDNLLLHGKNPDNQKHYKMTKLFIDVNYKSAYLAGYIFLNKTFIKNPFLLENYKYWKCSNKSFPDILQNLPQAKQEYFKKIWIQGIYDYLSTNKSQ